MVEILSIYDYTPAEIDAAWFNEKDMDRITQKCFKVLHRSENGGSKNAQKYCIRGLEGHSILGSISKKRSRSSAIVAVLEEQARQRKADEGIDAQAIADVYRKTTSSCQMWAQVIGNRDEKAVEAYKYEDAEEEEVEEADATTTVSSFKSTESPTVMNSVVVVRDGIKTFFQPGARAA